MFLQAPVKFGKSVGIGGRQVELNENNVGDFTGIDSALIPLLTRQGFVRVADPGAPLPSNAKPDETAPAETDSELVRQAKSGLALLKELDALSDEELITRIKLRDETITIAADTPHDTLVQIAMELTLEQRRKDLELASQAGLSNDVPPVKPGGASGETTAPTTRRKKAGQE